jgi:integrase
MALGKQAKVLTKQQQDAVLSYLTTTRNAVRNRVIFLLSIKAGLRAKEIASLTWQMVTDAEGEISDAIRLQDKASKGRSGGVVWLNRDLARALVELHNLNGGLGFVVRTERTKYTSAQSVVNMLWHWYRDLGFDGCSSHSGRRTFITNAARKISTVGGSMRDVQMLARHSSLNMTMRYVDADKEAMRKVVDLV